MHLKLEVILAVLPLDRLLMVVGCLALDITLDSVMEAVFNEAILGARASWVSPPYGRSILRLHKGGVASSGVLGGQKCSSRADFRLWASNEFTTLRESSPS